MHRFKCETDRCRSERWTARWVAVGVVLAMAAKTAGAAEFFAIVENTGKKPYASLQLAVDTRTGIGANVEFSVHDLQGTRLGQFFVPTNTQGFVSTESFGNLFDLSADRPMLIRARTAQTVVNSGAMLNVRSINGPMAMGVLPVLKLDGTLAAAGRLFSIAVGNFRSARLLIANISGTDQVVDVFQGTEGLLGQGIYTNGRLPNHGHWQVDLRQSDAQSNLVIQASGLVIVQLVIDDGKAFHSFMVPPGA